MTRISITERDLIGEGYRQMFVGADISKNQIAEARRLTSELGMSIEYVISSAESISFPNRSFDVVTACQCHIYFDKAVVLPKIHDVLKENGHFCILFMVWLPDESEIARMSEELVVQYNPSWTGAGSKRYDPNMPGWAGKYFDVDHAVAYDIPVKFTRESWHGRIKACRGIGASSLTEDEIEKFEQEHISYLQNVPEAFDIPHYMTILDLKAKRNDRD